MRVLVVEGGKPRVKTHRIWHPQEPGSGVVTVKTDLGASKDAKRKVTAYAPPSRCFLGPGRLMWGLTQFRKRMTRLCIAIGCITDNIRADCAS